MHDPGAAASRARALTVKGELFRGRRVERLTALRADEGLPRRHRETRRHIVAVGAAVTREAREHEAEAVQQFSPGAKS